MSFVNEVVEEQNIHRQLCQETVIRCLFGHLDVLLFAEECLYERYHFTSQSIIYLNNLLCPHILNITHHIDLHCHRGKFYAFFLYLFSHSSFLFNIGNVILKNK